MSRQIVLDTETTGLSADNGDRIIELGCVELLNRRLTGNNLHLFFNPDRDSHEDALKVHGISNEFLKDKPRFAEVVERVIEYLRGAEVIIHNAAFDLGFLDKELALTGRPAFRTHIASVTDTLAMAREMYPGKRNSLDALCERLGVNNSGRILHGALLDAELLADVYIHLTRGQDALLIADDAQESAHGLKVTAIDLRALVLPVVHASAQEQAAHAEVLAQIDKASGGKTIWRSLGSVP
ncbi:DNA polymerase III subunit epsilon [Verminephrobacter aporrectodeae subsp. tuberculatae]|uniref:DNA polymerase III subunit epsilon n=1 Tax=Verminephrobacter aporrectodeae TaxID=1110389 RepID=UPI002237E094|nr:DNA polymerase III subunit epsilon [Verminephrobacter aporrectodeae]MCW5255210.1 DNA polymerase III subunit epsilon [Verminephrobacter aporrectodeae subsp. tuberculatae]